MQGNPVSKYVSVGFECQPQAARYGYSDVVRLLLEANADPKPRDVFGQTALDYAVEKGHIETQEVLSPGPGAILPCNPP